MGMHSSDIWNMVPSCLTWTIWREHNWNTFEDGDCIGNELLAIQFL